MDLDTLTLSEFRTWPLICQGESKEIREYSLNSNQVVIWLRPTIYSFTSNRCDWIEGSNLLRARVMKVLIPLLKNNGIDHAYLDISDKTGFILAKKIEKHQDPNVEVIVKRYNQGTSYHKYYGLDKHPIRSNHEFWPNKIIPKGGAYPSPQVRFDWRNPFWNPELVKEYLKVNTELTTEVYRWPAEIRSKIMMRDEVLSEDLADYLINVKEARKTALWTYTILQKFLSKCNIVIYDLCLFITTDGKTVYGEINQDCGRFRHLDLGSLDKDVWRSGGSSINVLEKWELLAKMLEDKNNEF